tara:strand:+ start:464 stop:736 length:273 start_codon:yes stop_codon:yes gene_type:complete
MSEKSKHSEYWYFILPITIVPKPTWFNIAQEDAIDSVRYSLDNSQYILKALKAYVSPQMADELGASTYEQAKNHLNNYEPDEWDDESEAV